MKYFKVNSPIEQAVQEIETLLDKHNIAIEFSGYSTDIYFKGKKIGEIKDIENGEISSRLPRTVKSEKIVIDD